MSYPWRFYEKSVGMWIVESNRAAYSFPLETKGLDLENVSREYFHYFDEVISSLGDQFSPTVIEYPTGTVVTESPIPLYLYQAKMRLFEAWRADVGRCGCWTPGAVFRGLTEVAVQTEGKVISTQLPGLFTIMFSGMPGSDRYTLMLSTNCDIFLEKTLSGEKNPVGKANAIRLERALKKITDALDGEVVHFSSEVQGVPISKNGFAYTVDT